MEKETAQLLTQYGGEIYEDYSGRGMFGETTTAIQFEEIQDFYDAYADAVDNEKYDEENISQLVMFLKSFNQDDLGKGIIIY